MTQARPLTGGVPLSNLLADNKTIDEIFDLYTRHYLSAASGLLSAIGNNLHNQLSFRSRRELKRCIAAVYKEARTAMEDEARCETFPIVIRLLNEHYGFPYSSIILVPSYTVGEIVARGERREIVYP